MANVVGDRYQITIDKRLRDQIGVSPGDLAIEAIEDGRLVVSFVPRPHRESLLGLLRQPGSAPIGDWGAVMEEARRARSAEIMESLEDGTARGRRRR
jgi:bifunctional DNA-binding transcriptional regulator/antitoxin component of YhaV-PrlF toxin-antitoxin module